MQLIHNNRPHCLPKLRNKADRF